MTGSHIETDEKTPWMDVILEFVDVTGSDYKRWRSWNGSLDPLNKSFLYLVQILEQSSA